MNIDLNEEQDMLKKMSRDFLSAKCPGPVVRELMEDEIGYSADLYEEIAALGWFGLVFPPEYGGEGGSFLDLAVLIEEMGRVGFPGPFFSTVVLGGLPILLAGSEDHKKEYIPRICRGELLVTLALYEEDIRHDASGITMKATHNGDGYVLSGTKMFVTDAHVADLMICVARTGQSESSDGFTMFLVDAKVPEIECTVLKPLDGSKQCRVVFNEVKVTDNAVLGMVDKGWQSLQKILEFAAMAKCAEMLGGADAVLKMTAQYSKERYQFGVPIGSFQAIQQRCADMAIDVDGIRFTTYQAAWMLSEGIPCTKEVSIAKGWASDAYRRVVYSGMRVHGGLGVMNEHDSTIHYRKALSSEFFFGDARHHRQVVLQQLGL